MELKYDREITKLKERVDSLKGGINAINNGEIVVSGSTTTVLENRIVIKNQKIEELKELQKPIDVGLVS